MALPVFPANEIATPRRRDLHDQDVFALLYRDERWWTQKLISGAWLVFVGSIAFALCIAPIQNAQELAKRVGAINQWKERQFVIDHLPAEGEPRILPP